MVKRKAIQTKCLDCAAGQSVEVLFCTLDDCPLWEWRLGSHLSKPTYRRRLEKAWNSHSRRRIVEELKAEKYDISFFIRPVEKKPITDSSKNPWFLKKTVKRIDVLDENIASR
jgi:hypothetical protein